METNKNSAPAGVLTIGKINEIGGKIFGACPTDQEIDFARAIEREVLSTANAAQAGVREQALRYEWLRQYGYQAFETIFLDDGTLKWGEELDSAIDAAMRITPSPSVNSKEGGNG